MSVGLSVSYVFSCVHSSINALISAPVNYIYMDIQREGEMEVHVTDTSV